MKKLLLLLSILSFGLVACGGGGSPSNVDSVTLSESTLNLNMGQNVELTATVNLVDPEVETDTSLTISSSTEGIILLPEVVTSGVAFTITALTAGSTTLTVKTVEGKKTATCEITVNDAPAKLELYFSNNKSWTGTINFYTWNETTNGGDWPGLPMTYVGTNEYSEDIYKCEVDPSMTHIIFNNGSDQTKDIPLAGIVSGTGFYITDAEPFYGTYTYIPTTPAA